MRKAELDYLLLCAVAEALDQAAPEPQFHRKRTAKSQRQSSRTQARKHLPIHFAGLRHEERPHA